MKRTAILAYGLLCYLAFFGTFLYLIGFVSGIVVPRGIDGGPLASGATDWMVNLGLVALFAIQHTIMARPGFKARWTGVVGKAVERSTFVLVTAAILNLMFWQWRAIPGVVWSVEDPIGAGALWAIGAAGWLTVLVSTFLINHFELFGLQQTWHAFRGTTPRKLPFVTRGFYRYVRHPLMTGFLMAFWATPEMTGGHMLFASAFTVYILIGVTFEERDLIANHPEHYAAYMKSTPGLVPIPRRSAAATRVTGTA